MYGLVLEGGGAKGSFHIGAYKAILEEGIDIQGVAGTSIGALNGAMIVQGDYDICANLWEEVSYSMILDEEDDIFQDLAEANLKLEDLKKLSKKTLNIIRAKGFSIDKFKLILDKYINEEKIRGSGKDFGIVTFNLSDLKPIEITIDEIPQGQLKEYLMASAYLPIFQFERLGGKLYLDGGVYDNLPFGILQKKGYKEMILVRTYGRGLTRKIDEDEFDPIIISPSDDIGRIYNFDAETARRNINLGYYDGLRALRGLIGSRYYIDPKLPRDFGFHYLQGLEEEKRKKINHILGYEKSDSRRLLFEHSIPKLGSYLDLKKDFTYNDLVIGLLEKYSEYKKVDRFKLYAYGELLEEAQLKEVREEKSSDKDQGFIEKIMDKVDIHSPFNREDTIIEISQAIFNLRQEE